METDRVKLASCSRRRLAIVVFPAPEGEERMNISPRRLSISGTLVIPHGWVFGVSTNDPADLSDGREFSLHVKQSARDARKGDGSHCLSGSEWRVNYEHGGSGCARCPCV